RAIAVSTSSVAIVGSRIVGTTIAYLLCQQGYDVTIFEKGPEYPYPHATPFRERTRYNFENPAYRLPPDLQNHSYSGDYQLNLDGERPMVVGGSATIWLAETLRITPTDFQTQSRYGFAHDWPLSYDDLEEDYGNSEYLLGVSGTDTD